MKIQFVKHQPTPELAFEVVNSLAPLLKNEYEQPLTLPTDSLVFLWAMGQLDIVELLDEDKRVGVMLVTNFIDFITRQNIAEVMVAYVHPDYRKQGWFAKMVDHTRKVFQAKSYDVFRMKVPSDRTSSVVGTAKYVVLESEL